MEVTLRLEAHIIDTRRGIWCDDCALPSVVEADVVLVWPSSLRVFHRATESTCTECGR